MAVPAETLEQILEAVKRLERKVNALGAANPSAPRVLLSKFQAAKILGLDHRPGYSLDELLRTQRLRGIVVGKRLKIPRAEIDRFLREPAALPLPAPTRSARVHAPLARKEPRSLAERIAAVDRIKIPRTTR